jgi:hypothetical protein
VVTAPTPPVSGATADTTGEDSHRSLRTLWTKWRTAPEDRFGVLLFFVIMTIVLSSVLDVGVSYGQSLAVHTMSAAALVAALRATGVRPRIQRVVVVFVVVLLAALAIAAFAEAFGATLPDAARADPLWLLLVITVPALVLRRIAHHTVVGIRTVLGAIAAYLQIAVSYAAVYQAVDAWSAAWLFGEPQTSSAYMYVSLTTISTLGIGDIVPVTQAARLVLASEAVLGQIFLVTVVAIVVSRFASHPRETPEG